MSFKLFAFTVLFSLVACRPDQFEDPELKIGKIGLQSLDQEKTSLGVEILIKNKDAKDVTITSGHIKGSIGSVNVEPIDFEDDLKINSGDTRSLNVAVTAPTQELLTLMKDENVPYNFSGKVGGSTFFGAKEKNFRFQGVFNVKEEVPKFVKAPNIKIKSANVVNVDLSSVSVKFILQAENKHNIKAEVQEIHYVLSLFGENLPENTISGPIEIEPFKDVELEETITLPLNLVLSQGMKKSIPYAIEANVQLSLEKGPLVLPFALTGELDTAKLKLFR